MFQISALALIKRNMILLHTYHLFKLQL